MDNTAGDAVAERLASEAGARYLREPRIGLSRARNAGARAAEGELIAYLDDDSIAEPAWLERLEDALAQPAILASTGRILPVSPVESGSAPLLDLGGEPRVVDRQTPSWFEVANFSGLGFGGNMAFKRSLFDDGLQFRESLGAGSRLGVAEESYAFFRIIGQGNAVAYVPDAIVRHDEPLLPEERESRESAYRRGLAAYLFLMLVEEPRFRRRTVKYIIESIRHPPGVWRAHQTKRSSRFRLAMAACAGPALYLRSRFDRG